MDMNNLAGRFTAQYGGAMPFAPQMPSFGGMPDPVVVQQANEVIQKEKPTLAPQAQEQAQDVPLAPLSPQGSKFAQLVADGFITEDGIILKGKNAGRKWYGDKATQYIKDNGGKIGNLTPEQGLELRKIARDEYTGFLSHPDAMKRPPTKFEHVNSLADDWEKASKNYLSLGNSLGQLLAAAQQNSAAGDIAMIIAYNKMLDPGSVVREGEQKNAQNATGLPDRFNNMIENIKNGTRLSPRQRKEFIQTSLALYENASMAQKAIDKVFSDRANDYKINPDRIVYNPYTGLTDRVNAYINTIPNDDLMNNDPAASAAKAAGVPTPVTTPMPAPVAPPATPLMPSGSNATVPPPPAGFNLITPQR